MNEVKEAFKALDRNTRLVILQLQKEMKDLAETKYLISEAEKKQLTSRVDTVRRELLEKIVDTNNRIQGHSKSLHETITTMRWIMTRLERLLPKEKVNVGKLVAEINIKHLKGGGSQFKKVIAGLPDSVLPIVVLQGLPKLISAAKADAKQEPEDWTSLEKVLGMLATKAEEDETLVEMVKVQRAEFEGWSPDAR